MSQYTFYNSLHGTEAKVNSKDCWLSARQLKGLKKTLCGNVECSCDALAWNKEGKYEIEIVKKKYSDEVLGKIIEKI